jgi:hypothetical protein
MNEEEMNLSEKDIHEAILQQGIILKVLIETLIEEDIMTQDQFDTKLKKYADIVEKQIKELQEAMEKSDFDATQFYGQGGLA